MGYLIALWVIGCAVYWVFFRAPELANQPDTRAQHSTTRMTEADDRQEQEWEWYDRDPLTRGG